jgi:hypothetical protein
MDFKEQTIIEYVKHCQEDYSKGHDLYKEYLKKMEKKELQNFDEIQVEMVIKPFLYKWGKMGRVFGEEKCRGWEGDIVEQIHSNSDKLEKFRVINFISTNLTDFKKDIITCYESFKTIVDRVAATKILHIICPNFFPLWDNAIKEVVKAELIKTISKGIEDFIEKDFDLIREKIEDFSGKDYYIYMRMTQYFVERYKRTFFELAKTYKKGVVKVLDDFLWMIAHRPLSLFFQESGTM